MPFGLVFMYFINAASVLCPVIAIITIVGVPASNSLVAKLLRAVWVQKSRLKWMNGIMAAGVTDTVSHYAFGMHSANKLYRGLLGFGWFYNCKTIYNYYIVLVENSSLNFEVSFFKHFNYLYRGGNGIADKNGFEEFEFLTDVDGAGTR